MNIIKEIKLSYSNNGLENIKITESNSAYKILIDNWDMDIIQLQEEFKVLLLNRANVVGDLSFIQRRCLRHYGGCEATVSFCY